MTMTTTPVLQTKQKRVERSSFPFLLAFGKILVNRENKDQRKRRRGVCVVCEVKEHGVRAVRGGGTKCLHCNLVLFVATLQLSGCCTERGWDDRPIGRTLPY